VIRRQTRSVRTRSYRDLTEFGGLDRLDWLMILISVLLGTIAKQHHFMDLPDWFLEWVSPFLLMVFGYKVRRKITEVVESRRDRSKDTREE
jgi:hypothetical protein